MISFLVVLFSLNRIICFPLIGETYSTTVNVPLIGKQTIETRMINKNMAFIKLEGMINENGTARYLHNDNKEIIYLSWNLRKIMKEFKSEFSFPSYDIENDRIIFNLKVKVKPIFFNKKIILKKM
jgi:hypothetical protein